ncbi:MAG: hypothetical protein ABI318_09030 [Chthoniobacteraceae bacterium]
MSTSQPNYWAFRVDGAHLTDLDGELENGRLRQGWGWDEGQDLRLPQMTVDGGAKRNRRIFRSVKKDDRILIPHLPHRGQITIAEATDDWDKGYVFARWEKSGDHGHIFPVKRLRNFHRSNQNIPASLRGTFRNPCRFWNINHLGKDIDQVLSVSEHELGASTSVIERWEQKIETIVLQSKLQESLLTEAEKHFGKSEWEYLLTDVLQRLNPGWVIRRTGGKTEAQHGTDILATIPDVFGQGLYGIAIQIKDYQGIVGESPINQILKADDYWEKQDIKILERVVVLIRVAKDANDALVESARKANVRIIWAHEVRSLVFRSACKFVSDPDSPISGADSPAENGELESETA